VWEGENLWQEFLLQQRKHFTTKLKLIRAAIKIVSLGEKMCKIFPVDFFS